MTHSGTDEHDEHEHDRGFYHDLSVLMARRGILGVIGAGAAVTLLGAGSFGGPPDDAEANTLGTAADGTVCVKDPGETAGPFPGDGTNTKDGQTVNVLAESGVVRGDLRPSFGGMTGDAAGVAMTLTLRLVNVKAACAPLAGHAVYLWHADAEGRYSLYDLADRNYLRGVGITDADGVVQFTTIFPGCYDGRWPHMHFEVFESAAVAVSGKAALLTSQLAMPAAVAEAVYAGAGYPQSAANLKLVSQASDMVFRNNTAEQVAQQTPVFGSTAAGGLAAEALIGLAV